MTSFLKNNFTVLLYGLVRAYKNCFHKEKLSFKVVNDSLLVDT